MANNMLNCRFLRVLGVPFVRHKINSKLCFLPELREYFLQGNQAGTIKLTPTRNKHGSGRGSKRGQLSRIRDDLSPGQRPSTTTSAATSGPAASNQQEQTSHHVEHDFDSQYFSGILDRRLSEDDLQRVQSSDSVSKVTAGEDLNEFDSQYFQEFGQKDVGPPRNFKARTLKKSAATKPGSSITGNFMFEEIDLKYFDDINSSFVYRNTDGITSSDPTELDINEFDKQYFGKENLNPEGNVSTKSSSETTVPAKRYMDTSLSEEEMYRQHLSNRKQIQKWEGEGKVKNLKGKSFEAHDRPAQYQEVSKNDFADHREVHLITDSTVDESLLDSIPPDLRGKLVANRLWKEKKDELRVADHNLEDLEESVVSALKAVKKKRNKSQKPRRSKDMKIFGSEDSSIPVSEVPCSGCGAHLQCQDNTQPGFVPSEKFTELDLSKPFSNSVCQRCFYIIHRHTALNVSVPQDSYSNIIKAIRKNQSSLVILMVDLLDFPCSIIKNLKDLIGSSRSIVIVGNKLDVLPKDEPKQERRLKDHLVSACVETGACDADKVMHVELISAKSGYGVENLITKILSLKTKKGDVYLLGTANVGKSTLFNRFLESDLCKAKASSLMGRATISQWPGTTLNLLRFPLLNPTRERMAQRTVRLKKKAEEVKIKKKEEETNRVGRKLEVEESPSLVSYVEDDVGQTFKPKSKEKEEEEEEALLTEEGGDPFGLTLGVPLSGRDVARKKQEKTVPFNPMEFKESEWFYDTPDDVGQTFKPKSKEKEEEEEAWLTEEGGDPFGLTLGVPLSGRDVARKKQDKTVPFNPMEFQESEWFYDTPGVIYQEQVLTKLSSEELKLVVPKRCVLPRSLVLKNSLTLPKIYIFLQGKDSVYFTVFSSNALPIKVVDTQDADAVYAEKAGFKTFVVRYRCIMGRLYRVARN
eukprot:XP_011661646.1 PREDICTED: nitric oxide-associated protein 1 [Strongylocentrotus purpuratus]